MTTTTPAIIQRRDCQTTDATIALLAATWPATFSIYERKRRPLKIGIRDEILAAIGGTIELEELTAALRRYTGNTCYLRAMFIGAPGIPRIGLDGQPCGEVTPEQAATAAARLASYAAARRRRMAEAAPAPAAMIPAPPASPVAPSPMPELVLPSNPQPAGKRLGLADLREAARLRKGREAAAEHA